MTIHRRHLSGDNRRKRRSLAIGLALTISFVCVAAGHVGTLCAEDSSSPKIYARLVDPREHPDDERRAVRPPDWETFHHCTQLTSLRSFPIQGDRIVGYAEELELCTKTHELGDVISPLYSILFTKNLGELVDEIQRRKLYLFDIWGYVPAWVPAVLAD